MGELKLDQHYTISEYLDLEQRFNSKYEYFNGKLYAMSEGTIYHGMLISNTLYAIRSALAIKKKNCFTFSSDVKVSIPSATSYLYPDVFVVCNAIKRDDQLEEAITNPILIIEVLSKSTQSYDQTKKFRLYRAIPTFKEYVLIDQEQATVEVFYKESESNWKIATIPRLESEVHLQSLGIRLKMADLYQGLEF
ncbi:MAG: Uma2 family endonuclease [Flammeovirgaceae bacterium]